MNISVHSGEIVGLLGVNGAGKTTVLECVEGIRKPDRGNVSIHGRLGVQLQSQALPEYITVREAIDQFARWNRTNPDDALLSRLSAASLLTKQYRALSVGQKRRVHLALALLRNPDLLLLDEPTAGLDVDGQAALHQEIQAFSKDGKAVLLTSHDMAEVEQLCDRILVLSEGRIVFDGTAAELRTKDSKKVRIHVRSKAGNPSFPADNLMTVLREILAIYNEQNDPIRDIWIEHPDLAEQIMRLSKGA